jgi:hypothetical protein
MDTDTRFRIAYVFEKLNDTESNTHSGSRFDHGINSIPPVASHLF